MVRERQSDQDDETQICVDRRSENGPKQKLGHEQAHANEHGKSILVNQA